MTERRSPISTNVVAAIAIAGVLLSACGGGNGGPSPIIKGESEATVTVVDNCADGEHVLYSLAAFPSQLREEMAVWPMSGTPYWRISQFGFNPNPVTVRCKIGETVCVGAQSASGGAFWGVGIDPEVDQEGLCTSRWRFVCPRRVGSYLFRLGCS